jgi:hypothetical protein
LVKVNGAAEQAAESQCFVFGRERRALALRKIQQIQGALAPGLLFIGCNHHFSAASEAAPLQNNDFFSSL